ncbi:monooxygenase, partial [Streptomyces sp. Wh19]|nr:monooxygenase [Streptomyces sp. Wh19]
DAGAPHDLTDDAGHARTAYGVTPATALLVLIRPDNHVALIAPATESGAIGDYLGRLAGTA